MVPLLLLLFHSWPGGVRSIDATRTIMVTQVAYR